jgi:hypothetical protein
MDVCRAATRFQGKTHMKRFSKSSSPLLITESKTEFDSMAAAMLAYIKPAGILEEILVGDVIDSTWHIIRLQRNRTALINIAYRAAIVKLLAEELGFADEFRAEKYADEWFRTKEGKDAVTKILDGFRLDETSIEAEAIKILGPELETWERMVSSLEERRNKTLDTLWKVQARVASRAREMSDSLVAAEKTVSSDRPGDDSEAAE